MRFSELRYKEVICVSTGQRLGYVCDAELDAHTGKILSLIVPGPSRFFGLLGREEDYCLPWSCITRMGEDIILVEKEPPRCGRSRRNCRSG